MHPHLTPAMVERFTSKIITSPGEGCWEWSAGKRSGGYGTFNVKGKPLAVHRIAFELAYGPIPDGMMVCHTCDNRACCRADDKGVYLLDGIEHPRCGHLWLGTAADNMRDMMLKGRFAGGNPGWGETHAFRLHPELFARGDRAPARLHPESYPHGEKVWCAKLTEEQVRAIRAHPAYRGVNLYLAGIYGIHPANVGAIRARKTWKHLTD